MILLKTLQGYIVALKVKAEAEDLIRKGYAKLSFDNEVTLERPEDYHVDLIISEAIGEEADAMLACWLWEMDFGTKSNVVYDGGTLPSSFKELYCEHMLPLMVKHIDTQYREINDPDYTGK
jgi:hypothetical protein